MGNEKIQLEFRLHINSVALSSAIEGPPVEQEAQEADSESRKLLIHGAKHTVSHRESKARRTRAPWRSVRTRDETGGRKSRCANPGAESRSRIETGGENGPQWLRVDGHGLDTHKGNSNRPARASDISIPTEGILGLENAAECRPLGQIPYDLEAVERVYLRSGTGEGVKWDWRYERALDEPCGNNASAVDVEAGGATPHAPERAGRAQAGRAREALDAGRGPWSSGKDRFEVRKDDNNTARPLGGRGTGKQQ
ncbi:hypothetical protein FB451DRAFT_1173047 [Mycena latifolia]|nr:hypothetical protein FB451DRAFT_1173047 [Mycena latifolia]